MNLFVLDEDASLAAIMLDDKRLGSALMEATMMLSVPLQRYGEIGPGMLCRPSHVNHPVTLWVGRTAGNWLWTWFYAWGVWSEFERRYETNHAAGERLPYLKNFLACLPAGERLPFQNSARHAGLRLDFTDRPVVEAYRTYLKCRWLTDKRAPSFTNRDWPEWATTE